LRFPRLGVRSAWAISFASNSSSALLDAVIDNESNSNDDSVSEALSSNSVCGKGASRSVRGRRTYSLILLSDEKSSLISKITSSSDVMDDEVEEIISIGGMSAIVSEWIGAYMPASYNQCT
jgi:hypothetical protein